MSNSEVGKVLIKMIKAKIVERQRQFQPEIRKKLGEKRVQVKGVIPHLQK